MTELIRRDMTVGDIVEKYPQAAEVFLEYGLHCVGCHVASWETIEQGAQGHGMSDEEIEMMLKDANEVAANYKVQSADTIVFTDAAIERVKEVAKKMNKDPFVFRVGITEGGCSGFSYIFAIEEKTEKNDEIITVNGVTIVIDKTSYEQLLGCTVDYIDTVAQSGFKIHNPKATTTCGCGSSFA